MSADTSTEEARRIAYALEYGPADVVAEHIQNAAATLRALAQERDALMVERDAERTRVALMEVRASKAEAERDAARAEVERLTERVAWLEEIREGAGRALCEVDGIAPDEPISDGGHVAWELHVYQRARAALAATEDKR